MGFLGPQCTVPLSFLPTLRVTGDLDTQKKLNIFAILVNILEKFCQIQSSRSDNTSISRSLTMDLARSRFGA